MLVTNSPSGLYAVRSLWYSAAFKRRCVTLFAKRMRHKVAESIFLLLLIFAGTVVASSQNTQGTQRAQNLEQFLNQVWLMVTPIEIWCGPTRVGTATGFFFENSGRLYLVTNRHVVRQDDQHLFPG
jgi:S1-C subfamily serine protease